MVSKKVTRTLLVVLVLFLIMCGTGVGFFYGFSYVISQNDRFSSLKSQTKAAQAEGKSLIDKDTPGAIELVLPRGVDTKQIAALLKEKKIIDNTMIFTLLSKFNGFDSAYVAGTHYVTSSMNYDELMYVLSQKPQSVEVKIVEGLSYREVKNVLKTAGVNFDESVLDAMVTNPQLFLDYKFVTEIEIKDGRDWLLQGYLFPDTYEFDVNTDEETILRTFLNNTESKLTDELYARAAKQGMTMDQVITLASIIQNECVTEEMIMVSGVFSKRLKRTAEGAYFPLGSCATINYLRKEAGLSSVLYVKDTNEFTSPYNTYQNLGLPPGPICSPGEDAIRAALWPDNNPFWFFTAMGNGFNWFSKSEAEHQNKSAYFEENPAPDGYRQP